MTMNTRYAVLFKAYFMDDFIRRRLAHIVAAAPSGDVYLMMDETKGSVGPIDYDRVIRYQETDLVKLGFPAIAQGSLFWYNADYPLYYFQHLYPGYDTIIMIEYDAVPSIDLDDLVQKFREQDLDLIGHSLAQKTADTYWWTSTMLGFYARSEIRPYLVCAAVFSGRAIRHLAECRCRQGNVSDPPDGKNWPIGEAFVGTELTKAGFRLREMAYFGEMTRYDWWPPIHEFELSECQGEVFVHPVLSGRRFVDSLFKSGYRSGWIATAKFAMASLRIALRRVAAFLRLKRAPELDASTLRS
jgi:hypothetical protein